MSDWLDKRVMRIVELGEDIQLYEGYAEPGYSDPESGWIAVANWNAKTRYNEATREFEIIDNTMPRIAKLLEKLGVSLEWCDEWYSCCECTKLVRSSADSYGWQPSYSMGEGEVTCMECVDPKKHLERCVENGKGNEISDIKPEDHGYVLVSGELENGWYGGQKASPERILKSMDEAGVKGVLLNLDDVGQFDMTFSVYIRKKFGKKNIAKAKEVMGMSSKVNAKEDPADVLKRGLQAAAEASAKLPNGPGVKYTKINTADGTVESRLIPPEEFVKGIKD